MPQRVQGFCKEGHFHDIEVEDDVTLYFEWENGATGTLVTSTGDAPGMNRLEISMEEAMLVCENGTIRIDTLFDELGQKEAEYRKSSTDFFRKIIVIIIRNLFANADIGLFPADICPEFL